MAFCVFAREFLPRTTIETIETATNYSETGEEQNNKTSVKKHVLSSRLEEGKDSYNK